MAILTQRYVSKVPPAELLLLTGGESETIFTWDTENSSELSLNLNTCFLLRNEGWNVCLESPVKGVQRDYRVPVVAFKETTLILAKPVVDAKKVNRSGLKMLDVALSLGSVDGASKIKPVVIAFMDSYNLDRQSDQGYEIWFRSADGLSN